jgi:hypothetical protein
MSYNIAGILAQCFSSDIKDSWFWQHLNRISSAIISSPLLITLLKINVVAFLILLHLRRDNYNISFLLHLLQWL